jgi:hypothetical protein
MQMHLRRQQESQISLWPRRLQTQTSRLGLERVCSLTLVVDTALSLVSNQAGSAISDTMPATAAKAANSACQLSLTTGLPARGARPGASSNSCCHA